MEDGNFREYPEIRDEYVGFSIEGWTESTRYKNI
jgi:hypothetical protein